ncbi:biotin--[acetyl-CoA-carboxylase] ligase [Pelagibaculum spongiae]|uniref:biotin--[acetyl-CoA-carboxylase] ligase n=1 Tax=Pelagibaculum spongiae TaxID=2080658 RepID=UPI001313E36B|nr:biotin--[acetyl-CoA-carboxylase] ligase [Pelagibaculum spongiae]
MAQLERLKPLLTLLDDGKFHSGESLGAELGVSRAVIWKDIQFLLETGLLIDRVKGRGYRLKHSLQLLNQAVIEQQLAKDNCPLAVSLDFATESTNQDLVELCRKQPDTHAVARIVEYQFSGRGRRGKVWQSPPCSNLMFSVAWRFYLPPMRLGLLSLVVGVAIARALEKYTASTLQLKWPNDLLLNDKKLAGILVELPKISEDETSAVIGVGVNLLVDDKVAKHIDQPWSSLSDISSKPIDRNQLQVDLLSELVRVISNEACWSEEIASFWKHRDWLQGKRIDIKSGERIETGLALGINEAGGLMVATEKGEKAVYAGEVSVRRTQ